MCEEVGAGDQDRNVGSSSWREEESGERGSGSSGGWGRVEMFEGSSDAVDAVFEISPSSQIQRVVNAIHILVSKHICVFRDGM